MYHPIIKNKLNELKGLNDVNVDLEFTPIIEMVECKYDDTIKMLDNTTSKISSLLKNKSVFIDLPTYVENEIIDVVDMDNADDKMDFFKGLESYFRAEQFKQFIPVISFDYNYRSRKKSYRENIAFALLIVEHFDNFALRLFTDLSFKDDDILLLKDMYEALGNYDFENRMTLIFDIDKSNTDEVSDTIDFILSKHPIKKIILAGEAFNNPSRTRTSYKYDRIKNHHLLRVKNLQTLLSVENVKSVEYADFALLDKIPSKIEIDPDKGFLYYPFIKFTTDDGNMCMFTADEKGKYEQYQELCKRIVKEIKKFSINHCSTCKFIDDVANGDHSKFKAGSTWKYRMIAHHITEMSIFLKS